MRRRSSASTLPRWVREPVAADLFTPEELERQESALGGLQIVLWMYLWGDLVAEWCRVSGVRRPSIELVYPAATAPPGVDIQRERPPADLLARVKAEAVEGWMRGGWRY